MFTRLGRSLSVAATLLALGTSTSVRAQEPVITLREAISRTLQSNPDLAAYAYTLKAQDGRITQSGLRPNPTLSGTVENVLGTGLASGGQYAELTLMLSQVIELGGLRERRIDVARRERDGLQAEGDIRRLDTIAETARRFVSLASQQEQHQLTHLAVELAEKTAAAVEKRVAAAKSPLAERDRAAVALQRAQNDDAHAEHELQTARYALAASWAASKPDFVSASADLYRLPAMRSYDELLAALEATPDLARYLSEARLRDAEIALAIAGRRQGLQIGAGVRRLEQTRDTGLVFSFQMPLPVGDRNQGLIAEAEARREGAAAEREATLIKARTQLFGYYRELLDRQRQVGLIREKALPRMESALAHTDYAYERGRYSYLELVDAQRELLELKREAIEAAAQYHFTLIEIERLTGNGLSR
ncbi:TolC family protein [Hydrocarboniphaga effusa]|jgi:cobalt-zinc-cadmium efflux system outer membrane protein|uniref:TolC family protein n=3 Tax=Hydrocarboniphaga effusa TaxID=243629 RepID=UPI003138006B